MNEQTPALAAYAQAAQHCRDIAAEVGIRNCDNDPAWQQAERTANAAYAAARAAGHPTSEVLKAGRQA
ncbi:hypothetical protein ACKI14_02540 [Streptomyces turgidiscabies]|uniref:hypothetical protein n=1 Tax=Streptomyces turgidiscabies TaxID=85558 RepID=UPI0038F65569